MQAKLLILIITKMEMTKMENHVVLTKEGLKQLQERLDYLKNTKRAECTSAIAVARSFGDLSENSEYVAAKEEQGMVESEILDIEDKIRNAKVINSKNIDTSRVGLGCTVKVHDITFDEDLIYKLVGSTESDPAHGLLSNESPAGKAMFGKKVGETFVYDSINAGEIEMKVLEIKA